MVDTSNQSVPEMAIEKWGKPWENQGTIEIWHGLTIETDDLIWILPGKKDLTKKKCELTQENV